MLPVFIYTIKNAGESVLQAERKVQPSTLIPDMDNAIVGSRDTVDYTEISIQGISVYRFEKRCLEKGTVGQRGSALCFS